jgi:AraC-like DNA-binding protein
MSDYIFGSERIFFKHEISEHLLRDTYAMHIHGAYELIYFLDGDATHVIEDRKYKLKKHDLILIRPFQYHFIQIDTDSRYERYNILFDDEKHGVDGVKCIPDGVEIINLEDNAIAKDIFERCDLYRQSCSEEIFSRILSHLLSELFYNLSLFSPSLPPKSALLSPIISRALQYINENLRSLSGVREIATHLFVSESYLFRLFKKELHQSPKQYICEKRLLLAQQMLSQGEKPSIVSENCGFADYTTFYRNYVSYFGCSPSEKEKPTARTAEETAQNGRALR